MPWNMAGHCGRLGPEDMLGGDYTAPDTTAKGVNMRCIALHACRRPTLAIFPAQSTTATTNDREDEP
jgi:hypothetical protein